MRIGHTLLELAVALLLAAILASGVVPAAARYRRKSAVLAAREEVAGLLAEARAVAPGFGGAVVRVEADPWRAWIEVLDSVGRWVDLEEEAGVEVVLSGGRRGTAVAYDGLGVGRIASETMGFRRGDVEAGLTVSAFGRVRRW